MSVVLGLNQALEGWPDALLTALLLAAAAALALVALRGRPAAKALALAWTVLP